MSVSSEPPPSGAPRDPSAAGRSTPVRRDVSAAVLVRDGHVLLQTRVDTWRGHWEFPGGGREQHESAEEAVVRECVEELGLAVRPRAVLMEVDWEHAGGAVHVVFFVCDAPPGAEPRPRLGQDVAWVPVDELPSLRMLPCHAAVVRWLLDTAG